MIPSFLPVIDVMSMTLHDGSRVSACAFCKKAFQSKAECIRHYEKVHLDPPGYYQCPFGFTSRSFYFQGQMWIMTGVVAFPRFSTAEEMEMGKRYPAIKVAREDLEKIIIFLAELDGLRADVIEKAAKVFPQQFHELRKLNAAVLQNAEKEIRENRGTAALQTIQSAAELMRNNFDILEALSNIDTMRALPLDDTINVYDLVYKTRCVFLQRATSRHMEISVTGVRAIVRGSRKSFPIVPAVLLENAIKYGRSWSTIRASVSGSGKFMLLIVENETDYLIDPVTCFTRGTRFAGDSVEGGGFGLFLAKEIVLAHHGEIRCEKNGGTVRMLVKMPMEKVVPSVTSV
jgi:signal transduction histidine kinase